MTTHSPVVWWVRRDLRLADNPALTHAIATGRPVIAVFVHDETIEPLGAAPKWRFGLGIATLAKSIESVGGRLILRRGKAQDILIQLAKETAASGVYWSRAYDPDAITRDTAVKVALKDMDVEAQSFSGHLLFEPWTVKTKVGGYYKVYTPYWRAVKNNFVADCQPKPKTWPAPENWPDSELLEDWGMGAAMGRGADIVAQYVCVGEDAAEARFQTFLQEKIDHYQTERDFPAIEATSRLSENLTYGEIAPRRIWHGAQMAMAQGAQGAEHFAKELVWREFAYHLMYHTPHILTKSWREGWDDFGWRSDNPEAEAWRQGQTGEPMVDAAMRELFVTGTMHNRLRMLAGSYLTKHLFTDWRVGRDWFADTLIDWDPAANAMGWQWIAGCGPDAAPYFRVFNPETQATKFDPKQKYRDLYLKGGSDMGGRTPAQEYYQAIPKSWGRTPQTAYPDRIVELADGRKRALEAYARARKSG